VRAPQRLGDWTRAHAPSLAIVLGLLALTAVVLGTGIAHYPGFSDDEGTYVAQAWAARTHGSLAHYTYWYDHPPLGWLQLSLVSWLAGPLLSGGAAVADARGLMLLSALASAALVYVLARRLGLRRPFAALAVLLLVLSPLAVTYLRQVYLDNLSMPWLLGAFVLAASPRRRLWAYAASGVCFAVAILSKETTLLFLPALVLLVVQRLDRRTRPFCLAAFALAVLLAAIGYPLYALLKGELLPGRGHVSLVEALAFQLSNRPSTGSALSAGTASHTLVASWLRTDPWLLALGAAALPVAAFVRRLRPIALALAVLALATIRGGYLPQPFVIALLPMCALLIAGVLDAAWQRSRHQDRVPWLGRAIALAGTLALTVVVLPSWVSSDSYAMRVDQTRQVLAAERWIDAHVNRRARMLVDDTLYVDLVHVGFEQRYGAVWFYKLDFTTNLDPSIVRHLPQGWRAFDYVVSTPVIRAALQQSPRGLQQVRAALQNSRVLVSFGAGPERVEVRRVTGVGIGSGRIPPDTAASPVAVPSGLRSHGAPSASQRSARPVAPHRHVHRRRAAR
jgi:4-amino-4-deoxy-L-arabinose transferase-like glycosyltransferase